MKTFIGTLIIILAVSVVSVSAFTAKTLDGTVLTSDEVLIEEIETIPELEKITTLSGAQIDSKLARARIAQAAAQEELNFQDAEVAKYEALKALVDSVVLKVSE